MRFSAPPALLLCSLLAACATSPDALINREIEQSGPLKVHPGLVEKSGPASPTQAPAVTAEDAKATPVEQGSADSR
ncbi:MAG: hypothetical protein WBB96_18125 [Candidatus Dechloromonas phosphoritropha]